MYVPYFNRVEWVPWYFNNTSSIVLQGLRSQSIYPNYEFWKYCRLVIGRYSVLHWFKTDFYTDFIGFSRRESFDDLKGFETFHDIMGFICDFKIHLTPFCDTLFLRSVFYTTRSSQCGISKAIPCITFKKNIVPMNDIAHFFSKQCNFILWYILPFGYYICNA